MLLLATPFFLDGFRHHKNRRNPPILSCLLGGIRLSCVCWWHAESHSTRGKASHATTESEMRLSDVATIKTNFPEAHFWIVRRGSVDGCGEPSRAFSPEHIGVRVDRLDLLLPDYLFYALVHVHQVGYWKRIATGTLALVNIRVSDVRRIELSPSR